MSKEKGLSEETNCEFTVYARQLSKDLTNLMECLKKQNEDNKAILYAGRHIQKIILPVEEYKKMCQRLEEIDNAKPSEALEGLEEIINYYNEPQYDVCESSYLNEFKEMWEKQINTINQALIKSQEQEKEIDRLENQCLDVLGDNIRLKNVLEIIFEKNINMFCFKRDIKQLGKRFIYKYYQSNIGNYHSGFDIQGLTEEEFNTLKEMVE